MAALPPLSYKIPRRLAEFATASMPGVKLRRFSPDPANNSAEAHLPLLLPQSRFKPFRFKSTPMHKDPRFFFERSPQNSSDRLTQARRLADLNFQCNELTPSSKSQRLQINKTLTRVKLVSNSMQKWACDLVDTVKSVENEQQTDDLMRYKKGNRVIANRIFKDARGNVREQLNELTQQVIRLKQGKIWKQNHKPFMARVEADLHD